MLVECTRNFKDKREGVRRKAGERFEATDERVGEINGAGYGQLVAAVEAQPDEADEQPEEIGELAEDED